MSGKSTIEHINTSIYVTGLPKDTTIDEMVKYFSKCGILMEDLATGMKSYMLS